MARIVDIDKCSDAELLQIIADRKKQEKKQEVTNKLQAFSLSPRGHWAVFEERELDRYSGSSGFFVGYYEGHVVDIARNLLKYVSGNRFTFKPVPVKFDGKILKAFSLSLSTVSVETDADKNILSEGINEWIEHKDVEVISQDSSSVVIAFKSTKKE